MEPPGSAPTIKLENVGMTYPGGVAALDDLNVTVNAGEFLAILGPSGCGKSSLLKIVAGLQRQTSGQVRVAERINPPPGRDRAVVFQQPGLLPWFDVLANIGIGLRSAGLSRKEARLVSKRHLEKLGLDGFGSLYPHQLSGGMQQRAGVARAFAIDPPILLMDEPFAAVDAQTRVLLQEELLQLWEGSGKTVMFVTHSIEEAIFLADRILIMATKPGRAQAVVDVDLPRPRTEETRLGDAYLDLDAKLWAMIRHDAHSPMATAEVSVS